MFRLALLATLLAVVPSLAASPEFRGVWVATVGNIDWPSKKGLDADEQIAELIAILDTCKELNLNAVILQVRPMCDAFYKSELEPWSVYLTGRQGQSPGYDPLRFAVKEAHKRGLELHAWINPYRAGNANVKGEFAANHLVKTRPDIAKKYGKYFWLNPTHSDVQKHSLAVALDIVKRYDIDGIHMDDYFYPYPEADDNKKLIPFPDDDTWFAFRKSGGELSRDDWRRDAVNQFVRKLYEETHKLKPWVKVGISPFGVWRPGHPEGIRSFDAFASIYADSRLWLREGWLDYFTPQLYWGIDDPGKPSYLALQKWWANENPKGRHIWVGNGTHRHPPDEIRNQILLTRGQAGVSGNVHFSMKHLKGEKADALKLLYSEPAAIPESPWLEKRPTPSSP